MNHLSKSIALSEDNRTSTQPTENSEISEQLQSTELPGKNFYQELTDQLASLFSTEKAVTQIAELKSANTSGPLSNPNQIGESELIEMIKKVIVATESYLKSTTEKYTLGIMEIGSLAYSLKNKVEQDPDATWTTYAKDTFGDIIKLRTLQIYIRISRFKDCKLLAFIGVKTLDQLISKIKSADGSADEIIPYLEKNGLTTGLDFTDDEAKELIKDKIKELLKKKSLSDKTDKKQDKETYEKLKDQIKVFIQLHVPILNSLDKEERDDLLKLMEAAVANIKNAIQTDEDDVVEEHLAPSVTD